MYRKKLKKLHVQLYVYIYMYMHTCEYVYICIYIDAYIYIDIFIYTNAYMYIHTCIYTYSVHTYTCTFSTKHEQTTFLKTSHSARFQTDSFLSFKIHIYLFFQHIAFGARSYGLFLFFFQIFALCLHLCLCIMTHSYV